MSSIPVIDLASFRGGDAAEQRRVARQMDETCRDIGFFCVAGHDISDELASAMRTTAMALFRGDPETKAQVRQPSADTIRGFIGYGSAALGITRGVETPPDWKETFSIGPVDMDEVDPYFTAPASRNHFAANLWPQIPDFQPVWTAYFHQMTRVSNEIMRLFARALDLDKDFFARSIDRHISVLSAMYYPHQDAPPKPGQLRAGAHTDFGTMTILKPDLAPGGLQVQSRSGEWLPVRAPSGTLVVNIGDMMARWTNDRWVSTLHRVVNPPADIKVGTERLSIGFFHHPNYDALIECLPSCQDAELGVKHAPVMAGDHLYDQFSSQAL